MSEPAPTPGDVRPCARHADRAATYRCEACARTFCDECIVEGHALFLCPACGELALPITEDRAASPRERRHGQVLDAGYGWGDALAYPFRGSGRSMFLALLVSMAFVTVVGIISGVVGLVLSVALTLMVTALQLRIVRTTARGDDELPDWPDWDVGELVRDLATWLVAQLLQWALVAAFLVWLGTETRLGERGPGAWLGLTVCLWLGSALSLAALGAAGALGRIRVLDVPNHVRALLYEGGDAFAATNLAFSLGGAVFLARFVLGAVPLLGGALGAAAGAYWLFVVPHLAGVLFRRHRMKLERFYGDTVY